MLIVKSINQRIELFQQPIPNTGLVSKLLTFPKLRVAFEIEIENCPKLLTVALSVIKVDLTHGIPMKDAKFHKQSNFPRSSILYNRLHLFQIVGK